MLRSKLSHLKATLPVIEHAKARVFVKSGANHAIDCIMEKLCEPFRISRVFWESQELPKATDFRAPAFTVDPAAVASADKAVAQLAGYLDEANFSKETD